MRKMLAAATCLLALHAYSSELFHIESPALSPLPAEVEAAVKSTTQALPNFPACAFVGQRAALSPRQRTTSYLVTTRAGCAWGAANAPLWVVWTKGHHLKVADIGAGSSVQVLHLANHGMRDLRVGTVVEGKPTSTDWHFDSQQYKPLPRTISPR